MLPLDVLVVDDEPSIRKILAMWLDGGVHWVQTAASPKDALALAEWVPFDLAFVDLRLGVLTAGWCRSAELLKISPWLKIVVITAYATIYTAVEAVKHGADYLPKPFSLEQVELLLGRISEQREMERKLAVLQQGSAGQPGIDLEMRSPAMQQVLHRAQQAAKSEATVLIRGRMDGEGCAGEIYPSVESAGGGAVWGGELSVAAAGSCWSRSCSGM